jgi:hypothetical protein
VEGLGQQQLRHIGARSFFQLTAGQAVTPEIQEFVGRVIDHAA